MKKKHIYIVSLMGGVLLLFCPFFLNFYWMRILTNIFMYAILAQSINMIAGYAGYPAFGNVVFFGLGAYATAISMVKYNTGFVTGLFFAIIVCILFVLFFGVPILGLKGHYFAIATLGLNEATRAVIDNLTDLTGGGMGLSLPLLPGDVGANNRLFYYLFFALMILSILVTIQLSASRIGYALRSIRADEATAKSLGINTLKYKTVAWMVSAVFTGIAGGFYAYWMSYIEPAVVFDMTIAIKSFVMFLLGGAGTILGPILGAFFLELVSTFAWSHLLKFHTGALGLIIILIVILMPRGFFSFLQKDRSLSLTSRKKNS